MHVERNTSFDKEKHSMRRITLTHIKNQKLCQKTLVDKRLVAPGPLHFLESRSVM